jgi:16S rRNA (uracil1498-N3)-methyltransferase
MGQLERQAERQLQRLVIAPSQIQADRVTLEKAQLHYLERVLRLKSGDRCILMDGQGQTWLAALVDGQAALLESLAVDAELPHSVRLAIALPKGSGFEDVLRQVTELGVREIVPILSERTIVQPKDGKLVRWQKVLQEAAEQSERAWVPTIVEPIRWQPYLQMPAQSAQRLIAWERGENGNLLSVLQPGTIEVAIGPEGGWTTAEVEAAVLAGYQPVSLGNRILRAVTASVAVMAVIGAWQTTQVPHNP